MLRFTYLSAGLGHIPHADERYFVENVARMLATGSLDHGFYEYPGLMFYLLAPVLAVAGTTGAQAYLAARGLVAALGVAAVGLAYVFGARLAGRWAGLSAAAFLAVSPVHVATAHSFRPDVALEAFAQLAFISYLRLGRRLRDDARAGLAMGAAVGLKFSAGLLVVPYLLRRALTRGPRVRGVLLATVVAAAVFLVVSPYAAVRAREFFGGVTTQVVYHYQPGSLVEPFSDRLHGYAVIWPKALGPLGALLALAGLPLCMRRASAWAPFLVLPVLTALVFATSGYRFERHLIPSMSIVALAAGLTLQTLGERWPRSTLALALICLAPPLHASCSYLAQIGAPSTRDRVADHVSERRTTGRVWTSDPFIVFDRERFETLRAPRRRHHLRDQLWAMRQADIVVTRPADEPAGFLPGVTPSSFRPVGRFGGPHLLVREVPGSLRPRFVPVSLARTRLTASAHQTNVDLVRDGRLDTYWHVKARAGVPEWVEVRLRTPVRLGRVELRLGERSRDAGRGLHLKGSMDGKRWFRVRTASGRPPTRDQLASLGGFSEILLFEPALVQAVRVERRAGARRWSIAELVLSAVQDDPELSSRP